MQISTIENFLSSTANIKLPEKLKGMEPINYTTITQSRAQ